jgi:signal transduction histidine kinase/DNA-binding response OmpR family regulator
MRRNSQSMPIGSNEGGRVWVLEDSALEAEMVRRALAAAHHDVEMFTDGSVVLERAASTAIPDMVVLDWQLPGVSGVEVCRVLRATHDAMSLPILMLTSHGHKDAVLEALAAGANDYVTKPYDMPEVIARVSTLVRTSHLQRAQKRRASQLALSADIGAALTTGKNLHEIAERCCDAIHTHLGGVAIEVWTRRGTELSLFASRTSSGTHVPEPVVRAVAESQQPLLTDDVKGHPELGRHDCGKANGFAALPLVVRGESVGVLAFCTSQPLSDALGVLGTVADLLALGIARARIEEERAALFDRERNTRAEAEAANRSKDEFLAMVSHELRTPLNAITGWTSMLLAGGLDPARAKRALETIERSARSQAQLIDDLLDISRIVSGKLRVNVGSVDVPSIAEMALESVRLAADSKGVTLEAIVDPVAGQLTGDADRIQQIIWNLLSNAIKFTPKGGTVKLAVRREERGIVIAVDDTGQGIPPEFLPYVFERFKQIDGTMTRAKGGLGLGLAIVKHLIELHGGTIEVHSDGLGKGASFRAVLPGAGPQRDSGVDAGPTFSSPRPMFDRPRELEGLRVLVLDDEADARELIKTLLESCKMHVTVVSYAADAFDAVRRGEIDVVLSDIAMPIEDGLSFIKRVRALPREEGGRLPAVALTAYARLEDRTRALRAGFNSHVAKPVEASELLAVISSLVRR